MATPDNSFRSPLGRARGLGSAKAGAAQWLGYRLLAAFLVPLSLWFLFSVITLVHADHADVTGWLREPHHAVLMAVTVALLFHHAAGGMREVYEDYIPGKALRLGAVALTNALAVLAGVASLFAVLKIAFGA